MTEPITPERLAELRDRHETGTDDTLQLMLDCLGNGINVLDHRTKGRDNWISDIKRYQADHVGLLAEVDRLTAELERANARHCELTAEIEGHIEHAVHLEDNLQAIRGWTRSRLEILNDRHRDNPDSLVNAGKTAILDDLTRVLDHLDTSPAPDTTTDGSDRKDAHACCPELNRTVDDDGEPITGCDCICHIDEEASDR